MSFFTALADAYGGYGKGRQERAQEEDARAQLAEQKANDAAYLKQQQAAAAQSAALQKAQMGALGFDENGNPLPAFTPTTPGTTTTGKPMPAPLPVGWHAPMQKPPDIPGATTTTPPAPMQLRTAADYFAAAAQARQSNRPDRQAVADSYEQQGRDLQQTELWGSTVGKNNADTTTLIPSQAAANYSRAAQADANAKYIGQKYGIDMARIKAQVDSSAYRADKSVQAAQIRAQASAANASLSYEGRLQAGILAGYYAYQNHNVDAASRMAVAQVQDAERFGAAATAATKDPNAGLAAAQGYGAAFPPVSFNPVITVGGGAGAQQQPQPYYSQSLKRVVMPWEPIYGDPRTYGAGGAGTGTGTGTGTGSGKRTDAEVKSRANEWASEIASGKLSVADANAAVNNSPSLTAAQKAMALAIIHAAKPPVNPATQPSTTLQSGGPSAFGLMMNKAGLLNPFTHKPY